MSAQLAINSRGHLTIGGLDTVTLARRHRTPLYVMDEDLIRSNCQRYVSALKSHTSDFGVAYAAKAFMTGWICSVMDKEGLFIDVVSGGELYTALRAGFPADRILFHGNNKSPAELAMGLRAGVGRFVVDGFYELENLNSIARELGVKARVLLRISPDVEAHTHEYVETGMLDSKFGFSLSNGMARSAVEEALEAENLDLIGFHNHIGSQILATDGPVVAATKMAAFSAEMKADFGVETAEINLGGGLGIAYTESDVPPEIERYVQTIVGALFSAFDGLSMRRPRVFMEPGRSIVGEAGITLYTLGAIKRIPDVRTYVSVDGGMTDNPRPALYGSEYRAILANRAGETAAERVSIAGRCCESGDILVRDAILPDPKSGDIIAVLHTGAYNYSMASNYNRLPRPAVVAVSGGVSKTVVRRETYADLVAKDVFTIPATPALRAAVGSAKWPLPKLRD